MPLHPFHCCSFPFKRKGSLTVISQIKQSLNFNFYGIVPVPSFLLLIENCLCCLPSILSVIRVASNPDLDVGVDDLALEPSIGPRDVLATDDRQLDLPGRKLVRVESGRRHRAVLEARVPQELRLEDEAAAAVVRELGPVDEVVLVLRLVVERH